MQRCHLLPKIQPCLGGGLSAAPCCSRNPGPNLPARSLQPLAGLPSPPSAAAPLRSLGQSFLLGGLIFNKSALCFSVLIKI